MKWVIKGLIALTLLALLILALHWAYLYLLPKWAALAFYSYIGLGIVSLSGSLWLRKKAAASAGPIDTFLESFYKAKSGPSKLTIARNFGALLAFCIEQAALWPLVESLSLRFRREASQPRRLARILALQSVEPLIALFAFGFILSAYALGFAGVTGHGYGKLFVLLVTTSVVLRHIRYSLAVPGLPIMLRRVSANPYKTFLIIIAADLLSLVLGFASKVWEGAGARDLVSVGRAEIRNQERPAT